jgi:hypothetical protein
MSDIRRGAGVFPTDVLVAAGGGGGAGGTNGAMSPAPDGGIGRGGGGGGFGLNGETGGQLGIQGGGGGGGASGVAGGAAGAGNVPPPTTPDNSGRAGTVAFGGRGGNTNSTLNVTGGGGGGGWYGGGGGGSTQGGSLIGGGGGGGGGSSFAIAGSSSVLTTAGSRSGDGLIILNWGSQQAAAPTNVLPSPGATVNTNLPTLSLTLVPQGAAKQRGEWQLATSSDFVANSRVITEPTSDLKVSGVATEVVPTALKLFAGTWYLRARTLDEGGVPSPWSGTQQFIVAHAPAASPISPSTGQTIAYSSLGITVSWTFSSTSPDDAQTAYQVVVTDAATGTSVADTGKVVSTAKIANVLIDASKKNSILAWKVRVWDQDNTAGPYSTAVTFIVADAPGVAVDDMTTVATSSPVIGYNFTPVVAPIAQVRVTITKDSDNSLVYDSGWVAP